MPRTATDRANIDRLPPKQETPAIRPWPYEPDAATLLAALNSSLWHFAGIRATGSVPELGGPVAIILSPDKAGEPEIRNAGQIAETYWPNARSFDLVGGDLLYTDADHGSGPEAAQPGVIRLRNAAAITTFTVTDRPAINRPEAPAIAQTAPPEPAGTIAEAPPDPQAREEMEAGMADNIGERAEEQADENDPDRGRRPDPPDNRNA
jgi:hypothetical protein